ncbi:MAG: hypothetical protein K9N51_04580 [Candidatus Pacebacteria bacterium]|nr:hypothetical protein [Candidatus Paceibacterota bacterium]
MANRRFVRVAATALAICLPASMQGQSDTTESLLPAWRESTTIPILQYFWPKNEDERMRRTRYDDYREMGFTGIAKWDFEPPMGGDLFARNGMHGFLYQTPFKNRRKPILQRDGTPYKTPKHYYCNSVFNPANIETYQAGIIRFIENYGKLNLFKAGDTYIMSSWDETGLRTRRFMEYGYTAKSEFAAFLAEVVFKDGTPENDSNGDGHTFTRETGLSYTSWADIPMPVYEERYEKPGLWRLWCEFHAYYTYKVFADAENVLTKEFGNTFDIFTFSHATIKWPGRSSTCGLDAYWQSRLDRILTVEDCHADYPGPTIHYAFTDQLSRRYRMPVMGWSWFTNDFESSRAYDAKGTARALARAMGHNTHGLFFWVYFNGWAKIPESRAAVAVWHRTLQAHWDFLKHATVPAPQVAVVFPRNTGNMYKEWDYPKRDYGWTIQALSESHVPFEVIADNQVENEPDILNDYKVLIIPTATWESPMFLKRVQHFVERGGYVYTNGDSLMASTSGEPASVLGDIFGIRPEKKYKALIQPTFDSPEEHAWAMEQKKHPPRIKHNGAAGGESYRRADNYEPAVFTEEDFERASRDLPATSGTGLEQQLVSPAKEQLIVGSTADIPEQHRTFHDIVTGTPSTGAKALAAYRGGVCAVETERTLWLGFRPGFDLACRFPKKQMFLWGEPVWPFDNTIQQKAAGTARSSARQWLTRILRKARLEPVFDIRQNGQPAPYLELLNRETPAGDGLLIVINHEDASGVHTLASARLTAAATAHNLSADSPLQLDAAGRYAVAIEPGGVVLIVYGSDTFVQERAAAHRAIDRTVKDMPILPGYGAK